jgi:hypothetical protein
VGREIGRKPQNPAGLTKGSILPWKFGGFRVWADADGYRSEPESGERVSGILLGRWELENDKCLKEPKHLGSPLLLQLYIKNNYLCASTQQLKAAMNTFYEKYRVATWKLQIFGLHETYVVKR